MEFFLGFITGGVVITFLLYSWGKRLLKKPNGLVIYSNGERVE